MDPISNNFDIPCVHFEVCSGCSLNKNVDEPAVLELAREFF